MLNLRMLKYPPLAFSIIDTTDSGFKNFGYILSYIRNRKNDSRTISALLPFLLCFRYLLRRFPRRLLSDCYLHS